MGDPDFVKVPDLSLVNEISKIVEYFYVCSLYIVYESADCSVLSRSDAFMV